jgi:recombination protein RecR
MNSIEKLTQIFSQFPGIGPRQARRFVYYLLTRANGTLSELAENIKDLKNDVMMCSECMRFFELQQTSRNNNGSLCKICADQNRDHETVMLVQRDIDLESVERNGGYNGVYFVLGGSVPILDKEPEKRIRAKELKKFIESRTSPTSHEASRGQNNLKEIILGVNWNPEGENTGDYVKKIIESTLRQAQSPQRQNIKISTLGKGLSMGTELEYTDPDTLKNALKNRV